MFKLQPIENKDIAREIYPELAEGEMLFALNEDGRFTGIGVFEIKDETVILKSINITQSDVRELMFLAILSYAERRNVKKALCTAQELKDLCIKYGFNSELSVLLEGFFLPGKHCSKQ